MIKIIVPVLWAVTVLAATASIAFTLILVMSQSDLPAMQAVFASTGVAFELLKLVGLSLVFIFYRQNQAPLAIIAVCLTVGLSIFSLIGTSGALKSNSADKEHVHRTQSGEYQNIQSQISQLDQQIESTRTAAMALPQNYYTKRQNMLSEVDRMLEARQGLATTLPSMKVGAVGYSAYYASLGKIFGTTAEAMQISVYLFIAVLLEAITLTAPLFCTALMVKDAARDNPQAAGFGVPYSTGTSTAHAQASGNIRQGSDLWQTTPGKENKVGFDLSGAESCGQVESGIGSYINQIWSTTRTYSGKIVLGGRRKAADELDISNGDTDDYHDALKKAGMVYVVGSKTYPKKSQEEMLKWASSLILMLVLLPSMVLADTIEKVEMINPFLFGWAVFAAAVFFATVFHIFEGKGRQSQVEYDPDYARYLEWKKEGAK